LPIISKSCSRKITVDIVTERAHVAISDAYGCIVLRYVQTEQLRAIDVADFAKGFYEVTIESANRTETISLLVQ